MDKNRVAMQLVKISRELIAGPKGNVEIDPHGVLFLRVPLSGLLLSSINLQANFSKKQFVKDAKSIGLAFQHIDEPQLDDGEDYTLLIIFEMLGPFEDVQQVKNNLSKKGYRVS